MKQVPGKRLTTVFPLQGHYALDLYNLSIYPPVDLAIDHIGDLLNYESDFLPGTTKVGGM